MASISLEGVTKRYGAGVAVSNLSLDIKDHEFLALVGPSGCGKSTTLRMLAGLEDPTEGLIRIGDRVVNDIPARERDLGMVFQSYALYPHLSVRDNIGFGLRMRHASRDERGRRVEEAALILGLEDLLDRKPRQLSGGQRQRVALGRAIVRDPQAFLLDEPLSNLDAKLRVQTRIELQRLHRRLGVTFVYVTHDQVEAMTMGDRIAVLNNGVLQQVAPPNELYARPANMYVAGFIGSPTMNLIAVEIDGRTARSGGIELQLPVAPGVSRAVLGMRPEALKSSADGPIDILVDVVEQLGSDQYVYGQVGEVTLTARLEPGLRVAPGDHLRLEASGRIHMFDPDSGMAIPGLGSGGERSLGDRQPQALA